jgi:integrase
LDNQFSRWAAFTFSFFGFGGDEMAKKKKKKNTKNYTKRTNWQQCEKYIERLFSWAYLDNETRENQKTGQKKELPDWIITKQNTKETYESQVKQYCKWAYDRYGETNFRFYKKKWYDEYLEEQIKGLTNKIDNDLYEEKEQVQIKKEASKSVSTIVTNISSLRKFEYILEAKWEEEQGQQVQFGIISNERARETLKSNNIYRDIEDMKKSRPIWDKEIFEGIENELGDEWRGLWRTIGMFGLRLESALLLTKKDIRENHLHIEHGKGGKRSDVNLLNPNLLEDKTDYLDSINSYFEDMKNQYADYKDDRRLFDNFKKENGDYKKLSTIKTEFEAAIRIAGHKLGLEHVTPHSGRKFYANCLYQHFLKMEEKELDKIIEANPDKYKATFEKELNRINSKRKKDEQGKVLFSRKMTQEEKAALLSSCETSHHRIGIQSFYIDRKVARKKQGSNVWYN